MKSSTDFLKNEIKEIHSLSREYNGQNKDHTSVLLDLVDKHAKEIKELYERKDSHFTTEVGDLLILCHELLVEHGRNPDEVMELCYGRYKRKLFSLIQERDKAL